LAVQGLSPGQTHLKFCKPLEILIKNQNKKIASNTLGGAPPLSFHATELNGKRMGANEWKPILSFACPHSFAMFSSFLRASYGKFDTSALVLFVARVCSLEVPPKNSRLPIANRRAEARPPISRLTTCAIMA
jgi:hypothetical protein